MDNSISFYHQIPKQDSTGSSANFLSSLNQRIALKDIDRSTDIPKHVTTASDFSLFMELHAQADCIITHGGYG